MQIKTCKYFPTWIISLLVFHYLERCSLQRLPCSFPPPVSSALNCFIFSPFGTEMKYLKWITSLWQKKKQKKNKKSLVLILTCAINRKCKCTTFHLFSPHSSLSVWQISKACWFHHKQHFPQHLPLMYQGLESGRKKKNMQEDSHSITEATDHRPDKRTSHNWQKVLKSERGHDVKRCPSYILKPLLYQTAASLFLSQGNIFNLACPACFPRGKNVFQSLL